MQMHIILFLQTKKCCVFVHSNKIIQMNKKTQKTIDIYANA